MPPAPRGAATRDLHGRLLRDKPVPPGPPGPWRVTARISGGLVQISNNHESRVIRKAEVEAYLCTGKSW
ncbi:MAG: hypothetical protein HQ527_09195 [Cyanobacteria bacterium]|nr:hypothetical protein [Cyanobacteria bacterium bin.51]